MIDAYPEKFCKRIAISTHVMDWQDFPSLLNKYLKYTLCHQFYLEDWHEGILSVSHDERNILIINADTINLDSLIDLLDERRDSSFILVSKNKNIKKEIGWILSTNNIPLIAMPEPKPDNDMANYMQFRIGPDFRNKIIYDLSVNIIGGIIVYLLTKAL